MVTPADPTSEINTHHFTLTDGTTTLGLILCDGQGKPNRLAIDEQANPVTAMKVANGAGGLDDYQQPYSPISQVDFAGGMGSEYADQDMTRYLDGNCIDTSGGKILPAGAKTATSGYSTAYPIGTRNNWSNLALPDPDDNLIAVYGTFTAPATTKIKRVELSLRANRAISGVLLISSYLKSCPDPADFWTGSVMLDISQSSFQVDVAEGEIFTIKCYVEWNITSGTVYWAGFNLDFSDHPDDVCLYVDWPIQTAVGGKRFGFLGSTPAIPYFSVVDTSTQLCFSMYTSGIGTALFFELGGLLHAVNNSDDGAAATLWRNGYTGKIDSASVDKTVMNINAGLGISSSDLVGKIVRVVGGPGASEAQNWRTIVANTTTTITVSPGWKIALTTATQFVISADTWTACTITPAVSSGLAPTKPITDVCIVDDRCYLMQGDQANICRVVMAVAAAGPTYTGTDEGAKADLMKMFVDTDGKKRIFMTENALSKVYKCEVAVAMSTRTQVNNSLTVGSSESWITGLQVYDDPQRPFVFKEDGFGSISNGVYGPIPIGNAMRAVRSRQNGLASCTNDRFLYFSMGEKLMRYYAGDLTNIGPDRDYGLPYDRRGNIVDIVPYPGGVLYAAVDAGDSGYSSILKYNGQGWTEIYRAALGVRIRRLYIQNIPGIQYQRLWFSEEEEISWIAIAANPLQATGFPFASTAILETGWFRTGYKDIKKFWNSVKLFIANNSAARSVQVYYRTETNTSWSTLGTFTTAAPSQEIEFNPTTTVAWDITGLRIQLKFAITTPSPYTTAAYIEYLVLSAVTRIPTKLAWHMVARVYDHSHNLLGDMQDLTADTIKATLAGWANSDVYAKRLLMQSADFSVFNNKRVFIDPGSYKPLKTDAPGDGRQGLLVRLTLIEA